MRTYTLALFFSLFSSIALAETPLQVKEGLWEITISHSMSGMQMPAIPKEALEGMPPEQRAQFESRLKAMGSGTSTMKDCVTKEKIAKHKAFNSKYNECGHKVSKSTGRVFEADFNCDKKHGNSKGTLKVEVVDENNVKGTMHTKAEHEGREMGIEVTFTSKYIGADCGDTKP